MKRLALIASLLAMAHAGPVFADEPDDLPDPRTYLYQQWPEGAERMDCVIYRESGWIPSAYNRRSGASGLAQFLPSTWAETPQGQAGESVWDAYANIRGAIWLAIHVGWWQWETVQRGMC